MFGKKKITPQEQMRENKRMIARSMRELDRERMNMQNQEKKLIIDIKSAAKKGQMSTVKIMAKDLVRTRQSMSKFVQMKSQLQAVQLRLQAVKSTEAMTRALQGVTMAMTSMNGQLNPAALNGVMTQFMRESERMDITQEMFDDSMDMVMEGEDDEAETDRITQQVLDEIGVEMDSKLGATPSTAPVTQTPQAAVSTDKSAVEAEADLEQRLNNLRRT